jgi:hypothetical protein
MSKKMQDILAWRIQERRVGLPPTGEDQTIRTGDESAESLTADQRAELDELIDIAASIRPRPIPAMPASARLRVRSALLWDIAESSERRPRWYQQLVPNQWPTWATRSIAAAVVATIMTAAAGSAAVSASHDALPGNALYPVKTTVEQLQLAWTTDDAERATQYMDIAARRAAEASAFDANVATRTWLAVAYAESLEHASNLLVRAEEQGKDIAPIVIRLDQVLEQRHDVLAGTDGEVMATRTTGLARAMSVVEGRGGVASNRRAIDTLETNAHRVEEARTGANKKPESVATPKSATLGSSEKYNFDPLDQELQHLNSNASLEQEVWVLRSKMAAIQSATERGQLNAAQNNLDALINHIEALHQSGRISEEQFRSLRQSYESLRNDLQRANTTTAPPAESQDKNKKSDAPPAASEKPSNAKPGPSNPQSVPGRGLGLDKDVKPNSNRTEENGNAKSRGVGPPQLRPEPTENARDENRAAPASRSGRGR